MRVLVACEESQEVCKAFRELGHEAYSCDILPCSGGHPEWHIQDDVLKHLDDGWDLMIAHPPCTYLSNAGARYLYPNGKLNKERYLKGLEGKSFLLKLLNSDIPRICVENPTPSKCFELPKPSQIIQPYEFGNPYSKRTLLWLKNLQNLHPTDVLSEHIPWCSSNTGGRKRGQKYSYGVRTAKQRSKTFPGIAKAMAEQWGKQSPPENKLIVKSENDKEIEIKQTDV